MTPDVSPACTRVLLALVRVYERDGRATVRDVASAAQRSPMTVHHQLLALRDLGLVQWEPRRAGTLRPAVRMVRTHVRQGGRLGAENPGGDGAVSPARPPADDLLRRCRRGRR